MKTAPRSTPPSRGEGDPHHIKVLMYHRLVDDERLCRAHWTCVHVQDFRKQLEFLDARGFTAITFNDYRLFLSGELNLPRKPVIITFDDGYLDTYLYGFPMLQEFGMKAVVFVLGERESKDNFWDRQVPDVPETMLMSAPHILGMHEAGFEIGAHTMSHPELPLLSEDDAWTEIVNSKEELERLLDGSVRSFSYPYGILNDQTKRLVERAGFDIAYSVDSGPIMFGEDLFETRRTTIINTTTLLSFGLIMLTPFQVYEWTRWKARQILYSMNGRKNGHHQASPEKRIPSVQSVQSR